jgi:hypothetical protein
MFRVQGLESGFRVYGMRRVFLDLRLSGLKFGV